MGRPGQTRFTGERPVAVLMGGNIVDSRVLFFGGGSAGTLLGPEGTATVEPGSLWSGFLRVGISFWSGFRPGAIPPARCVWGRVVSVGLGFGGVFVNWIVDASI